MYIPAKVYRIPENNDYNSNESEYSYKRMVQSDNIVIFWNKEFGDDPATNPECQQTLQCTGSIKKELERFYNFYVNDLKLRSKERSPYPTNTKVILYVLGGTEGTAFGGGIER